MNSIFKRGSSRNYTGETISASNIEMLLRAGMAAPTAMNTQPWEFVVVQDREKLNKIMEVHPYSQMLKDAGAAIIVCADTTKGLPELQEQKFWIQDCSAATENILVEATELNLGAVWLGTYPKMELCHQISDIFGLPKNIMPVTIISIGHPSSQVHPKDKFDKKKIHFNKW